MTQVNKSVAEADPEKSGSMNPPPMAKKPKIQEPKREVKPPTASVATQVNPDDITEPEAQKMVAQGQQGKTDNEDTEELFPDPPKIENESKGPIAE